MTARVTYARYRCRDRGVFADLGGPAAYTTVVKLLGVESSQTAVDGVETVIYSSRDHGVREHTVVLGGHPINVSLTNVANAQDFEIVQFVARTEGGPSYVPFAITDEFVGRQVDDSDWEFGEALTAAIRELGD